MDTDPDDLEGNTSDEESLGDAKPSLRILQEMKLFDAPCQGSGHLYQRPGPIYARNLVEGFSSDQLKELFYTIHQHLAHF